MFNLFQNISKLIYTKERFDPKLKEYLISPAEEYNMNDKSLFLDIGSGFGKPVFHAAFQVGCESKGIEVVPARVEFCIDFFYEFLEGKKFFEEHNKKFTKKNVNENDDEDFAPEPLPKENNETNFLANNELINSSKNITKIKIYADSSNSPYDVNFVNRINLNSLNSKYYRDVIQDTSCNIFLELKINPDIVFDESYINMILSTRAKKIKSIFVEDTTPKFFDDPSKIWEAPSVLKFGNFFKTEKISVEITPIDDHIYSNLIKTIGHYLYKDGIDREIFFSQNLVKNEKLRDIHEIVGKINNLWMLEFVSYVNSVFNTKNSYLDINLLYRLSVNSYNYQKTNQGSIQAQNGQFTHNQRTLSLTNSYKQDLYEELREELKIKEKIIKEQLEIEEENTNDVFENREANEMELQVLKEILVDTKFAPYDEFWYKKTSFIAVDATTYKFFANDNKQHYTHIYAYNKLMSKECRSKIAKILNKTKFKILAWYSNPKQTKKAGLKNFTFLCKFPMQSTSTEKFHVYVYIKTK